jgi:hypothetical protein
LQDWIQQEVIEITIKILSKEAEKNLILEIFQTDKKRNMLPENLKLLQEIENYYFQKNEVFFQNSEKCYHNKNSVPTQNSF